MQYTLQEQERLSYIQGDTLYADMCQQAVDAEISTDAVETATVKIKEAMSSLTAEDFLVDIIEKVIAMSKQRVTKADVGHLAALLEDLLQDLFHQADYARSELNDAVKALKGN